MDGSSRFSASRLSTASDGHGNLATYTHLANSPLVGQIAFANNGTVRMTTTKQYDYLNRLTAISSGTGVSPVSSFRYTYNQANQRTQVTNAGIIATNGGNLFVPQTPENFGYDADGNQTNSGRWTITWDAENRATSFARLASAPLATQRKVDCAYDFQGRRTQKIVSTNNGSVWIAISTNRFVYDGWNVVGVLDGNDNLLYSFARGTDLSGSQQGAGGVGGLLTRTDAHGSAYYHMDGNGNVALLVDGSGNPMAKYLYDSYGNTLGLWGTLAAANTYRFSSKEIDPRTGQYYYGYRYYEPNLQRWPNHDPIGERGGINLYGYVGNNPINYFDPLGLSKGPGGWVWGWWDVVTFYPHAFYDLGYAIQDAPGKWNDAFKKAEAPRKKKEDEMNNDYSDSKCKVPSKANSGVDAAFKQGIGSDIGDIISDVPGTSFTGDIPSVGENPGHDLMGTAIGGTVPGSMESDPVPKNGK